MVRVACMLDSVAPTFSVMANFDANALNPEPALLEGFDGYLYVTSFARAVIGPCFSEQGWGTVYVLGAGFTTAG